MSWKYSRGEWEEIVDPLAWVDGEEFEAVLERNGYYAHPTRWGYEHDQVSCDIYSRKGEGRYPVLLSISLDGNLVEHVFVYDFPSMMMFFREHSTPFVMAALGCLAEDAGETLRRAFHAWHGHDADDVCRECDPNGYHLQQERNRKRALDRSGSSAV